MVIQVSRISQILPQVEQETRGSPAELIEEGAQAEDQQGGHAETVVPEGEAQERQQGDPALPAAQAGRGAPQRGPMGPGIRGAAGMLLLLLHRLHRRLTQPARARKRSPIRLRRGEPGGPTAHTWVMNKLRNTSSQTQIAFILAKLMFQFYIYFSVSINVKHHFFLSS